MKKTNIRVLTQVAMLVALQVILSKFCSISTNSIWDISIINWINKSIFWVL